MENLFNFEDCTRIEEVAQVQERVQNSDDSCLQDERNSEEASQAIHWNPSYIALISDDSSEHVYILRVEAKGICEEIMTDTWSNVKFRKEIFFGEVFTKGTIKEVK